MFNLIHDFIRDYPVIVIAGSGVLGFIVDRKFPRVKQGHL